MLRDLSGTIVIVVRKTTWLGTIGAGVAAQENVEPAAEMPMTPRSALRRLV